MKVYYDKWGKGGHKENFKVENSETFKFGYYIFYGLSFIGWQIDETFIWSFPLDELEQAEKMFRHTYSLGEFNSDLPKLKNADQMFSGCVGLTTFNSDLISLTDGSFMFSGCRNLTSFSSKLTSLKTGLSMFSSCKLDESSLIYIADYINDISSLDRENKEHWTYEVLGETKTITGRGRIDIGHDESVSQDVRIACGNKMIEKGWDVYFNGTLYEYTNP